MQYKNLKVFISIFLLLFFFSFLLSPNFTVAEENECPFAITASPTEFEVEKKHATTLSGKLKFEFSENASKVETTIQISVEINSLEKIKKDSKLLEIDDKVVIRDDTELDFQLYPQNVKDEGKIEITLEFKSEPTYDIPPITITLRVLTDPVMEVELRKSTLYLHSVYNSKTISNDNKEKYPYELELIVKNTETKCSNLNITFDQNQDWLTIEPKDSLEILKPIRENNEQTFIVSIDTSKIKPPYYCTLDIIPNEQKTKSNSKVFELKPTVLELVMSIDKETLEKKYTPSIEPLIGGSVTFDKLPRIEKDTSYKDISYVQLKTLLECIDVKKLKEEELLEYQKKDDNAFYRIQFEDKTIILIDNNTGKDLYMIIPKSPMTLGSVKMLNYEGITMLSTRSIADIFDMDLGWDGDKKQITLRKELVHSSHYLKEESGENN